VTITRHGISRYLGCVLFVALTCANGTWAQHSGSEAKSSWRLKKSSLQLRLNQEGIVVEAAPQRFFSSTTSVHGDQDAVGVGLIPRFIPFSSINTVIQEIVVRAPVQEEIGQTVRDMAPKQMFDTAAGAGEAAIFLPALPVIYLGAIGAMAPFRGVKTNIQSVRILWTDNGVVKSSNFELSAEDSETASRRISEAIGMARTEVYFDSESHNEHTSAMNLNFAGTFSMGPFTFDGGKFRILVIKCSDGTNLIYFFSGDKQMPRDAVFTMTANSSALGTDKPWKVRFVRDSSGSNCLSEIDTDSERLQVKACQGERTHSPD
jgi:hypothetical protein